MLKNIIVLVFLSWVTLSYAAHPIAKEHMGDAESFKVESAVEEQDPQRSVAGEKIKKQKKVKDQNWEEQARPESDSAVRYWKYSEE
jgi:hypothetical protein